MNCSTDYFTYADLDPWYCDLNNGSTLYCLYPLNCECNATTAADPDIAGPGVISSFIIVAWTTLFVALVPAFFELLEFWEWVNERRWPWRTSVDPEKGRSTANLRRIAQLRRALYLDKTAILRKAATGLLGSLCDLQVVTGLGIIIASFAQLPEISFYHESIAMNCWWLTLNSFWAARIEGFEGNTIKYSAHGMIRRVGVFVSVILGTTFQCLVNKREQREWDMLTPGRCYLNHDDSSSWPWVGGTAVYAFSLLLTIIPWTRPVIGGYQSIAHRLQNTCVKLWSRSATKLGAFRPHSSESVDRFYALSLSSLMIRIVAFILMSSLLSLYWLLLEFLAAWSYGDGFYPLLLLIYIGFGIWNTYDILDVKISSRSLIDGPETKWGFGQILPLVLLLMIIYNTVDAFKAARQEVQDASSKAQTRSIVK